VVFSCCFYFFVVACWFLRVPLALGFVPFVGGGVFGFFLVFDFFFVFLFPPFFFLHHTATVSRSGPGRKRERCVAVLRARSGGRPRKYSRCRIGPTPAAVAQKRAARKCRVPGPARSHIGCRATSAGYSAREQARSVVTSGTVS